MGQTTLKKTLLKKVLETLAQVAAASRNEMLISPYGNTDILEGAFFCCHKKERIEGVLRLVVKREKEMANHKLSMLQLSYYVRVQATEKE